MILNEYFNQHVFDNLPLNQNPSTIWSFLPNHSPCFNSKQHRCLETIGIISPIHRHPQLLPFFPLSLQPSFPDIERNERAEGEGVPGCSYWNRVHWPTLPQPARDQASANATHPFPPFHSPSFFPPFLPFSPLLLPPAFLERSSDSSFASARRRFSNGKTPAILPTSLTPCCLPEEMF